MAAQVAGPASLLAWAFLSLASYPFAYTFSHLSARNPVSGGIYSFAKEAFGARAGALAAWLFIAWVVSGAPAISLAAGAYLASSIPLTRPETFVFAALLLIAAFLVNYRGIKMSGRVQLVVVAVIVAVLSFALAASIPSVMLSNFTPFMPNGPASVGVAAALIVWSYLGYENVSNVAEEFKDPKHDFNRSVAISVLLVSILYLAVAVVLVGTAAYRNGGGITPFSTMMSSVMGNVGAVIISVLAILIIFSTVNAYTAGMARIIYAAARDGSFPSALARVDKKTGAPSGATLALLTMVLLSLCIFYLLNLDIQSGFLGTSGAAILVYIIGSAAGIRLLNERGARRLLPWASLLVSVAILPFIGVSLVISSAIALAGLAYSFLRIRKKS